MSDDAKLTPQEVLEQLRALQARIPDFALLPAAELRRIRRAGYDLDRDLAREAVEMVGASKTVQDITKSTPEELIRAQEESDLWTDVERALRLMVRGVSAGNAIRRRRFAEEVRRTVELGATLVQKEEHHDLVAHVESVRRIRKRRRGK